tara:strand:- start:105 stop:818 length:714 start_codon:yes stop_codon:yes gene_type:complete
MAKHSSGFTVPVSLQQTLSNEFSIRESRLIKRLNTPKKVQAYLNKLPYNQEPNGKTLRSFRGVIENKTAHCMEAALTAATILEQHGYPPLLLSFESIDYLDHVLFVYQQNKKWGSIGRSRDPGLHGRNPVFRTARDLALSYVEPYVDQTGRITGYAVVDLGLLESYDWRLSNLNVWKTERLLQDYSHKSINSSNQRIENLRKRFILFSKKNPGKKPLYFREKKAWSELPAIWRSAKQ